MDSPGITIVHDSNQSRFSTVVDGQEGVLDYRLRDGVMTITHTGVPAPVGGRGIAAELMKEALAVAGREGWKVDPACSYAATYMNRHPEFASLRA